jgi:hypothetical protein
MSIRTFASHLGVSDRMVSKWEAAGGTLRPGVTNQTALDASLASAEPDARARFYRLAADRIAPVEALSLAGAARVLARHPIDGKLMVLIDGGSYLPPDGGRRVWLPSFWIDAYPTTCDDFDRFVGDTGHRRPEKWPGGEAIAAVRWADAQAYMTWASKELPTPSQLRRAASGDEGVVIGHLDEWCRDDRGRAYRLQRSEARTDAPAAFRTLAAAEQMLALLAI